MHFNNASRHIPPRHPPAAITSHAAEPDVQRELQAREQQQHVVVPVAVEPATRVCPTNTNTDWTKTE
jgi:hypothetical protein